MLKVELSGVRFLDALYKPANFDNTIFDEPWMNEVLVPELKNRYGSGDDQKGHPPQLYVKTTNSKHCGDAMVLPHIHQLLNPVFSIQPMLLL